MNAVGNRILVVAAHPDDEVLGCGGSIARWASEGHFVHILLLADGESARARVKDGGDIAERIRHRHRAADEAAKILGITSISRFSFADNRMDGVDLLDVIKAIESVIDAEKPDCVLTHHAGDVNVDHRVAQDAVLAACRPQPGHCVRQILFFEVPSSTEWRPPASGQIFAPKFFVDISDTLDAKLNALQAYRDELREFPHPRSLKAVEALARWRGASSGVSAAEAFCVGRLVV
jgi:LmbE family N-acetylglucosaminyl deacetylase